MRGLRGVHSRAEIDRIIQRETARADRTGHEFSLVLFRVKSTRRFSLSSQRLVKIVMNRVRNTDEMGWFDDKHLCALLPDTGAAGAWRFAEDVCDLVAGKAPRPTFVVYSYPTDWLDGHGPAKRPDAVDHPHRRSNDHGRGPDNTSGTGGNGQGGANGSGNNGNGSANGHAQTELAPVGVATVSGDLMDGPATKPLENLLIKKMPVWKRTIDIFGALFGIVIASPFLIFAAVGIKLTEPSGPIIFYQRRSGLGGRPFWIYKFRTMCVGAEKMRDALKAQSEQDGPAFKMTHDPRITRIGRFLRKTSIDELPQLFNILKGDMTLVGPRPLPVSEQTACQIWQRRRLDVTPGLTCIWQVKGRSQVTFAEWMRMDLRYIRRRTLWHDMSLIAQTVKSVLMRRGAV
ncbi:MAG TPA: sugar transferase [Tepidisphaeraceae bacterium]|jgi:lipopolysaccharide/colanic/teichoic acid biosynthesis glycosyltransferase|nr:sugar transferase [Tepidisphaeraceae bacterium]